ncbi:hypothetical protein MKW94_020386 [Papaver nudicaule]|uniref:Cyclin-like domain-containing protein n=1 Tax=Papaver nudicaule TaxID=74823 RepID=A0AA41S8Q7_PAPNU|nr:hypothetical protein [Papaver nudicaule]
MAGLVSGDPSNHAVVENAPCNISPDKQEESDRWYFSRKEIEETSPSRSDGIDLKKETYLRKSYCTFLQDLGMRLKVPQVTIATAIIFCHRFFLRQSHAKNDRRTVATVCMFLAGKVEETPRPLKDVIVVSYEIINKKDPAAAQKIKQKEVYEQQKELILLGERVVLATLDFDFNLFHPYKPLVEAIKKFKVAQNALAQVAWNFVNDGLRTSLFLQFKCHHIAAGAIFLAAKFLKVKLPSDGEKLWWQEFDVTPRQLEEVSNQMLELYEQNRLAAQPGSEVEGSATAGVHRSTTKAPKSNEESVPVNGHTPCTTSSVKAEAAVPSSTTAVSEHSYGGNQNGSQRSTQNRSNDNGTVEMTSVTPERKIDGDCKDRLHSEQECKVDGEESQHSEQDHKMDGETKDYQHSELDHKVDAKDCPHSEQESLICRGENVKETSSRDRLESEHFVAEDQERNSERKEMGEAGEEKSNVHASQSGSRGGRSLDYREGSVSQSPLDAIKKLDRDKLKAALERRKSRVGIAKKMDLMDDDDLIERELEDGIELAVEREKLKQERRQSWSNSSNSQENQKSGGDLEENIRHGNHREVSLFDDATKRKLQSPGSSNRKRKAVSPDTDHVEGN